MYLQFKMNIFKMQLLKNDTANLIAYIIILREHGQNPDSSGSKNSENQNNKNNDTILYYNWRRPLSILCNHL